MKGQKGFSLVELLVVIIIIGIIAAIAIPNLLSTLGAANEKAAVGTLRTIHSAQTTYLSREGEYGEIGELNTAGLLDGLDATNNVKSGYAFTITIDTGVYCALATPENADEKTFGINASGTLYDEPTGCAAGILAGGTISGS
jgi:prepilin-type N-terminal cleavage/methylation domain-containing protein